MTTKEKIIDAAVREFSTGGFTGARVENIARNAGINKAMIFYYFGSKEALYKIIIKQIVGELFEMIKDSGGLQEDPDPGSFIDIFTESYIGFFSKRRDYMKIIGTDMIVNPLNLKEALRHFFDSNSLNVPENFRNQFIRWYQQGIITEPDPMHLFLNIISLCIFPLMARVFPEVIFNLDLDNDQFISERIRSVQNIIKNGIIK